MFATQLGDLHVWCSLRKNGIQVCLDWPFARKRNSRIIRNGGMNKEPQIVYDQSSRWSKDHMKWRMYFKSKMHGELSLMRKTILFFVSHEQPDNRL